MAAGMEVATPPCRWLANEASRTWTVFSVLEPTVLLEEKSDILPHILEYWTVGNRMFSKRGKVKCECM